jgi:hypothetical protein
MSRRYASDMFNQLGTRVFILTAYKDEADDLCVAW